MREILFYVDDSGSRDPDRHPKAKSNEPDWFAFGGVLVDSSIKQAVETSLDAFRKSWPQMGAAPLRSYDVRNMTKGFNWLQGIEKEERTRFYEELTRLVVSMPVAVLACVVDRPGYNAKYREQYGPRRWKLCRTAFNIAVERAAKYAMHHQARLRVYVERSDKPTEAQLKEYYADLRSKGAPFDAGRSQKYGPMDPAQMHRTLFEFRVKTKESRLMQLADLVLWPVCRGGYSEADRAYAAMKAAGQLLDAQCNEQNGLLGIKYSCFKATP